MQISVEDFPGGSEKTIMVIEIPNCEASFAFDFSRHTAGDFEAAVECARRENYRNLYAMIKERIT